MRPTLLQFRRATPRSFRLAGWGVVAVTLLALASVTWLRWMDPVVDFGRELYIPWRILEGEHPVRDFVHLYGPLSVYFNAGLFAVFGVAIQTLVWANLVIMAAVTAALVILTRRAFGFFPAVTAVTTALPVFAFQHYNVINNYTFAAPYSHEATHGMLLLLLTLVWMTRPGRLPAGEGGVTGLLLGLATLTKTEYVLVAGLLGMAGGLRAGSAWGGRAAIRWMATAAAGLTAVWVAAWLLLQLALSPADAARAVANALLAPFELRALSTSPLGLNLLGVDHLGENLFRLAWVGGAALVLLAGVGCAAHVVVRSESRGARAVFLGLCGAAVLAGMSTLPWRRCATVFPALLLGGTMYLLWRKGTFKTRKLDQRLWTQLVFALAALGMLARMAFDPRVNHYGFFQALLAGVWVIAFLLGEWPRAAAPTRGLRWTLSGGVAALLVAAIAWLGQRSWHYYRSKDFAVGIGRDRMLSYRPEVHDLPRAWENVRAHLAATTSPDATLLVVPEGLSLNYWTRRRHPLRILDVLPATMTLNRREVLEDLKAAPPDRVVLVTRDMSEFGFATYGLDDRSGQPLLNWIGANYTVEGKAGDYPFTPGKSGLWLLRRRQAPQ